MREAISEGYKAAMKARDARRTGTLRAITAAIQDKDIEARGQGRGPMTDDELLVLLQKMVKQREESFGIYAQAGRNDLATVEKEEIDIISEFLPQPMGDADVDAAIAAAIDKTGASSAKDMGKVIASLKAEYPGRIDFSRVAARVKAKLG